MKPTGRYCFCLFHLQDPRPKWNHKIASSRAKNKIKTNSDMCEVWGYVLREIQIWTKVIWKNFTKKRPNRVDFPGVIFNFSKKKYVFFPPPYAWLESYGCHGSFGSLSFLLVLWVLSSRNTHSDTASYFYHSCFQRNNVRSLHISSIIPIVKADK